MSEQIKSKERVEKYAKEELNIINIHIIQCDSIKIMNLFNEMKGNENDGRCNVG